MNSSPAKQPGRRIRPSRSRPSWWTDAQAARRQALEAAQPCVIILNADSGAL